jgi:hypothetical protein
LACQESGAIPPETEGVASQELIVVLPHRDGEVVLRLGEETVGVDKPEPSRGAEVLEGVPGVGAASASSARQPAVASSPTNL